MGTAALGCPPRRSLGTLAFHKVYPGNQPTQGRDQNLGPGFFHCAFRQMNRKKIDSHLCIMNLEESEEIGFGYCHP